SRPGVEAPSRCMPESGLHLPDGERAPTAIVRRHRRREIHRPALGRCLVFRRRRTLASCLTAIGGKAHFKGWLPATADCGLQAGDASFLFHACLDPGDSRIKCNGPSRSLRWEPNTISSACRSAVRYSACMQAEYL